MSEMERYEMQICGACEALHDSATGAGEYLNDDEYARRVAWLEMRLREWDTPVDPAWSRYDEAIRQLIVATLETCRR